MNELQDEHGITYLIISHNLPVVRHISDKLAIMYLGRLVETGESTHIFKRPAHPYTEALVNGVPQPDPNRRRSLVSIEGEVPSLASRPTGCEFHTRCKYATDQCRETRPSMTSIHVNEKERKVACHYPLVGRRSDWSPRNWLYPLPPGEGYWRRGGHHHGLPEALGLNGLKQNVFWRRPSVLISSLMGGAFSQELEFLGH